MTSESGPKDDERGLWRDALRSTFYGAVGAGLGVLALYTLPFLILVAFLCLIGIGWPLAHPTLRWVRRLADLERGRLRRLGHDVPAPYGGPSHDPDKTMRSFRSDTTVRRDLAWLFMQATWGLILGVLLLQLPVTAVHDITYPLWWTWVDPSQREILNGSVDAETWSAAGFATAAGIAVLALWLLASPKLLELQTRPGVNLLGPDPDMDLSARVAELTATRAAALDAHAVELRRIERALHDGAQNRIVAVAVLLGAARREIHRDPDRADEIMARAQDSAETALAELRDVVRSILPPVLENRGLEGALSALASGCPVPCHVTVDVPVRCPVSVEAAAYFVVAESLTNVAKHSGASRASVLVVRRGDRIVVVVGDDGDGGADPAAGSGLAGITRRVEAHDGEVTVISPAGGPTEIRAELPCG